LSTDIKGGTYGGSSGSGNTVPPLAKEWNLWLDDYILLQKEREIVRDIARTREEVLQDDQIKELSSANYQKVGMDWKAKYRLRHNWYRGSSTRTRLCDSDLPSLRLPPFGRWMGSLDWGEVIKTRYHNVRSSFILPHNCWSRCYLADESIFNMPLTFGYRVGFLLHMPEVLSLGLPRRLAPMKNRL